MNYLRIFTILTILIGCKNNSSYTPHDYRITRYQKVDSGYHYSKDIIAYHSVFYRPIVSSEYINNNLVSIWVFKSEGRINYSRADLEADTLLTQMLNIPDKRSIEIGESQLKDNGEVYQIMESLKDSIYSVQKDTLFLYNIIK